VALIQNELPMSIDFLRELSRYSGPVDLIGPDDVNNVLVLRAAGLVTAFTFRKKCLAREAARFLSLTVEGRAALAIAAATAHKNGSLSTSVRSTSCESHTNRTPPAPLLLLPPPRHAASASATGHRAAHMPADRAPAA
jgi:hypothetical protein